MANIYPDYLFNNTKNSWLQWSPYFLQEPKGFQQGFQLDIVGFIAILGEGSVQATAQVATLSNFAFVPRLMPAPQSFLRPSRPEKLEPHSSASVIGIHSGNTGQQIHHIAHALHRGDKLQANEVKCVRITEDREKNWPSTIRLGPLAWLAILGCLLACGLFALAIVLQDGLGMLATILLSFLSTMTGIANKWSHVVQTPKADPHSPPADVVIKYPQGAFIIVKCEESTARYLYFNNSERCQYMIKNESIYRGISLISTILLIGGVIGLANATTYVQLGYAVSYILVNICYWIVAALPPAYHWDLSRLKVEDIKVVGGQPPRSAIVKNDDTPTYTKALWKTIAVTGASKWLREAGWAPKTQVWDEWLDEAECAALEEPAKYGTRERPDGLGTEEVCTIRNWSPQTVLSTLLTRSHTTFAKMV